MRWSLAAAATLAGWDAERDEWAGSRGRIPDGDGDRRELPAHPDGPPQRGGGDARIWRLARRRRVRPARTGKPAEAAAAMERGRAVLLSDALDRGLVLTRLRSAGREDLTVLADRLQDASDQRPGTDRRHEPGRRRGTSPLGPRVTGRRRWTTVQLERQRRAVEQTPAGHPRRPNLMRSLGRVWRQHASCGRRHSRSSTGRSAISAASSASRERALPRPDTTWPCCSQTDMTLVGVAADLEEAIRAHPACPGGPARRFRPPARLPRHAGCAYGNGTKPPAHSATCSTRIDAGAEAVGEDSSRMPRCGPG